MFNRRKFLGAALCSSLVPALFEFRAVAAQRGDLQSLTRELQAIEQRVKGRLGVAILDTASGVQAGWRQNERFPMCSTFKMLLAGAVLARVDQGKERLDRAITYTRQDLVTYSPVTEQHTQLDVASLCEAILTQSDNTAANLLLATIDGPAGLTRFARSLGDEVSRLDRIEPELNSALPDDPRDTTSPVAMIGNLRQLLLGDTLTTASRERLIAWMISNRTGDTRLRARLPSNWKVGDKTGAGERGTNNDIGIIWPGRGGPILVASYLTGTEASAQERNAALADVGALIVKALG